MLAALLAAAALQPGPRPATARAVVRIVRPARVTAQEWQSAPRRSERLVLEPDGRKVRLRTVEYE